MDVIQKGINTTPELKTPEVWLKNTSKDLKNTLDWPKLNIIYKKSPITSNEDVSAMLDEVHTNLEKKNFDKKNIKLVNKILVETWDNMVRYTPDQYKNDSEVEIEEDKGWGYLSINTINYFDNWNTNQNNFINNIGELQKLSEDELKKKEKKNQAENEDLHEGGWAGRWYVFMMRIIKRFMENNKIPNIKEIIIPKIKKIWKTKFKFNMNIKIPITPPMPDTWLAA